MKINLLLILFCFLKSIICAVKGVNQQSLQKALISSFKSLNTFNQSNFNIQNMKNFII